IDRGCDDRFASGCVVLDTNEARVVVGLEPGGPILENVQISARGELHLDRSAEILAGHEALYGDEVALRIHSDCHDPMTHEFVNEKLAVVVLRKWSGRAAEVIAVEDRTCLRGSSAGADGWEVGRCCVRAPDGRAA